MANKMLIDATHPEETRVVVLRGNRVEEFDFESANRRQLRGNIYLAKVTRVEPSLQAAFVDYGGNRHGFLAFSEIHPDYYQIPVADRQALIEEEERAHRAAEVEADRRAAARSPQPIPAARAAERDHRVTSEPVAQAEPEARGEGLDLPINLLSTAGVEGEPPPDLAGSAPGEGAPADVRGDAETGSPPTVSQGGDGDGPAEYGAEAPAEALSGAEAADDAGTRVGGVEVDQTTVLLESSPGTEIPDDAVDGSDGDDEGDEADKAENADTETANEDDDENDEDDENDDENDEDDEDDEEEDESAPTEDTVESVGGADALEEVQERAPRIRRQYKIQEVIRRRQIMLVQVVKEERGTKGAALTTYLSLAGRYSVLMPNTARGGGISRKITNPQDRGRLKEIAQDLEVPEGMGVILRTAGALRTKMEIKRDFEYLLRMWEQVRDLTLKSSAPTLVYEEGSVVKRAIRDLYSKEIDEIIVAGEEAFHEAKDFMRMLMPSHAKNVKPYTDSPPLLIRYGVESQLDAMFSPIVQLRSGGYIVLNQAEALVAIDVNSGRATREHHIEDTALKTNLEAAEEIARQLRLRDLAGLIVIDFIDMDEKRNNRAVERRLKECLKNDRARIQVGRISHFGLLEMSRQRIRTSVFESSTEKCPHCGGTGHVRSVSSVALQCLRMLEELLLRGATHNITVRTGTEIALYMLNQKRAHLRELEQRFRITVAVRADGGPNGQQPFVLEKAEQVHSLEQARALAAQPVALVPLVVEEEAADETAEFEGEDVSAHEEEEGAERAEAGENGGRRRRRRRRRGRREERPEAGPAAGETAAEHAIAYEDHDGRDDEGEAAAPRALEPPEGEGEDTVGEAGGDQPRRRRRGRRGGRRNRRPEGEAGAPSVVDEKAGQVEPEIVEASADLEGVSFEFGQPMSEPVADARQGAARDELPQILGGAEQAPLSSDQADAAARPLDAEVTAAAAETSEKPSAPAKLEASDTRGETPRRRSTIREPVGRFPNESGASAATETAPLANAPSTPEPSKVDIADTASTDEQPVGSRRTGWWARQLMGGDKG